MSTLGPVADEVSRLVHAFSDRGRRDAVRRLTERVAELESRLSAIGTHPLAPLVARLTSEWTRLHQPSTDWEVTGGRDALRGMVGVIARFLKVEMP